MVSRLILKIRTFQVSRIDEQVSEMITEGSYRMTESKETNGQVATRGAHTRRWDPFPMFSELEAEMDRLVGRRFPGIFPLRRTSSELDAGWAPSVDIFEKDGEIQVKAELPGVSKDDIEVSVEQDALVIKGERKAEEEVKKEDFYRMERFTGTFYRSIPLPEGVDEKNISATYADGVLEVHVPRPTAAEAVPTVKKIAIK